MTEIENYWHERAREELAERYPDQHPMIVMHFEVAWSGWECDSRGALITRDGVPEIVVLDAVNTRDAPTMLVERLAEYRRLIAETEAVLQRYRDLGGSQ